MTTDLSPNPSGAASDLDLFEAEATGHSVETKKSDAVPSKYEGKTVDELIEMNINQEKLIGRQSQEVGTIRRMADQILDLKKSTTQIKEEPRTLVTVADVLNDPDKAIHEAVARSDVAKRADRAEARINQLEAQITEKDFVGKHKDFGTDVNDPDFLAWVNKNPLRQALAAETAKKNFVAAQNLWDMWDEFKELSGSQKQESTQEKPRTVPNTVKSAPTSGAKGKPIYSRSKLMELRMKVQQGDPAAVMRYNDPVFQQNMNDAYAENRVR